MGNGCSTADRKGSGPVDYLEKESAVQMSQPFIEDGAISSFQNQESTSLETQASRTSVGEPELVVQASEASRSDLQSQLDQWCLQSSGADRDAFLKTLRQCTEVLAQGIGGALIVVLHDDIIRRHIIDFNCLDGGILHRAMESIVSNINEQPDAFKTILEVLSAHTDSDRWEQENLVKLVEALPDAAGVIGSLEGQPKDGAILISHLGVIHGATLQIKAAGSKKAILQKANGTAAGTRHNSSLSAAFWLSEGASVKELNLQCPGIVFTRSDAGGAHCFIPGSQSGEPPSVLHFETIHHLSQKEMLNHFKEKIRREGTLMRKKMPALGRLGIHGEQVVTLVGGRITSETRIAGEKSHMVLRAATPDQESYVLPMEKFRKLYLEQGIELDDLEGATNCSPFLLDQVQQLKSKGFKLYKPRPDNRRYIYKLQSEDLKIIATRAFLSSWNSVQPVRETDYLASPEDCREIYLMPQEVVMSGYAECHRGGASRGGASGSTMLRQSSSVSQTLRRQDTRNVKVWSQQEMLDTYGKVIQSQGVLMVKFGTVLMRPAKRDETVITCVNGRITASTLITDDDSKVAQGQFHELFVLSQVRVEDDYEARVQEIPGDEPLHVLYRSQGFKMYTPRKRPKYFYKITAEMINTLPEAFRTSQGLVQTLEEGDFLVMPEEEPEIYILPEDRIYSYRSVTDDGKSFSFRQVLLGRKSTRSDVASRWVRRPSMPWVRADKRGNGR